MRKAVEGEMRLILKYAPFGILLVNQNSEIVTINTQTEKLFGYSSAELVGQTITRLIPKNKRETHVQHMKKYFVELETRPLGKGRYMYGLHRDGHEIPLEISLTPIKREGKSQVLCSIIDITERLQAEKELKRLNDELVQKADDLARSNAELEQFAYVASHDLQEPLRKISCFTDLFAQKYQDKIDEDAEKYIHFIVDGAIRMKMLITDLLTYSRAGKQNQPFESLDCMAIVNEAVSNLHAIVEENLAEIFMDDLPTIEGNRTQLVQVFQNLIGNAVKFRGEDPIKVHLGVEQKEKCWEFSVCDNGIGIDPQFAEKIFVIFQRLHSRGEFPGTGLGLAICKKIIENHGGRIWVESQPGKGSTFYFTIEKKGEWY